jgi:hypothetical protein
VWRSYRRGSAIAEGGNSTAATRNMIVWLNEAAGESPATIRAAIAAMLRGGPQKQTPAKIARSFLPWERAATLLFER